MAFHFVSTYCLVNENGASELEGFGRSQAPGEDDMRDKRLLRHRPGMRISRAISECIASN